MVLPYRQALNSGALLLGLTFGLPAIVPAGSGLASSVDRRCSIAFDAEASDGLLDALAAAPAFVTAGARDAALATAAAVHPAEISRRFAIGLRRTLDGGG